MGSMEEWHKSPGISQMDNSKYITNSQMRSDKIMDSNTKGEEYWKVWTGNKSDNTLEMNSQNLALNPNNT